MPRRLLRRSKSLITGLSSVARSTAEGCAVNGDELIKVVARGGACKASALGGKLTAEQVKELLAVAPSEQNSRKVLIDADFSGLTFVGSVSFRNVRFAGDASFTGANFRGDADLALLEGSGFSFQRTAFSSKLYADYWTSKVINFKKTGARMEEFVTVERSIRRLPTPTRSKRLK